MKRFEFQVDESFHRKRLDEFLFNEFTHYSKAYLRGAVKRELCQVNGYIANTGIELRENDFVEIFVEPDKARAMEAQKMELEIVFEDSAIIVIDKPAGILVHPTHFERDGTILNGLTFYLNKGREPGERFIRPHLVHRLDRETSGILVVAKTAKASRSLCRQIKKKRFRKIYHALVEGVVGSDSGEVNVPIGRDPELKKHLVVRGGKPSISRYKVLKRMEDRTLVQLEPVTGRTNQLRIHCAHLGNPIVGDELHGSDGTERLCLHASSVNFMHPHTNEPMAINSQPVKFNEESR
ncbi:MAG: RluA family pseudouridine synthase [Pyrinomonadaceae bacterium]|nr:RluA family pseudouridine synthase [Pyrinomonadaceae bacterium]